ncbi:MAG: type IX secretion system membrane protein PorP/SprF [Bacteroidota bacterium]|nr:type IX secretion system membrane protein PorP/SprF [Bacteroidota bacterium]
MKKSAFSFLLIVIFLFAGKLNAQQLPDFTQYPAYLYQVNPAYTGTKSNIDARLGYRKQWMGYDGAPVTQMFGLHSRLLKGRIGLGTTIYKDVTGPSQRFNYSFTAAYHLRFPDVEFSVGFGVNFNKYTIDATKMTTHWTNDPTVDQTRMDFDKTKNAMVGLLLYNDRFHFGLGVVNIVNNKAEFFTGDTTKLSRVSFSPHYYFSCGYNFNGNSDFVWENNLLGIYVLGLPMTLNYNLRVHYDEKVIAGLGWRMKDAVYLQAGYVFFEQLQFIYSYDIGISHLRKGHSGSHEVMLGYRTNFGGRKGGYKNSGDFQKQKYNVF